MNDVLLRLKSKENLSPFFFPMVLYNGFISEQNGMEKVSLSVEEKKKGATLLENKV